MTEFTRPTAPHSHTGVTKAQPDLVAPEVTSIAPSRSGSYACAGWQFHDDSSSQTSMMMRSSIFPQGATVLARHYEEAGGGERHPEVSHPGLPGPGVLERAFDDRQAAGPGDAGQAGGQGEGHGG